MDMTMPHMTVDRPARELMKIRTDISVIVDQGGRDGFQAF